VTARDVEAFFERYTAAWRQRDAAELRRMGHVTTDAQEAALRDYFGRVRDLDVQIQVLSVVPMGDRCTVRFTRRDTFRNPSGRLVSQETPPLDKDIVRTRGGLRLAPVSR
jgi:hypothetical protein